MSDTQRLLPPGDVMTVARTDNLGFTVRQGDRYADGLSNDEALFVVATWIISPHKKLLYLRTEAEQRALEQRLVKVTKELPIVTE